MAQQDRTDLQNEISTRLADNNTEEISAEDTRTTQTNLNDSCYNILSDDSDDVTQGSVNLFVDSSEKALIAGSEQTANKGAANGYASLGADGKIPDSQIPDLAISEYLGAVPDEPTMLALTGEKGDWCTRTDLGTNWVITGNDPSVIGDWTQLSYPTAPVTSVNSKTGAVVLNADDLADGSTNKMIKIASQNEILAYRPLETETGSFTFEEGTHGGKFVNMTITGAVIITVDDSSVPSGAEEIEMDVFWQSDSGSNSITFAVGGSQSIISKDSSLSLNALGSAATLKYLGSNTWALIGDLA